MSFATRAGSMRHVHWLAPLEADSGPARPPVRREQVSRMAPTRNAVLCKGIDPDRARLWGVKPSKPLRHVPWPVGRGWICLRCSHYERGEK